MCHMVGKNLVYFLLGSDLITNRIFNGLSIYDCTFFTTYRLCIILDDQFNIVEDKPAQHLLSDGVSITMNEGDYHWCKECYIYLIVVMVDDMRLYVTADA